MTRTPQLGIFFLAFLFAHTLPAQLNVKIGYDLTFLDPTTNNLILARNNDAQNYEQDFSDLKLLNGVQVGIRQKFDVVSFELSYGAKVKSLRAEGLRANSTNTYENKLSYNFHRISAGWESYFGTIGLGATLDYNMQNINAKFEGEGTSGKQTNNGWGTTAFLSFNFEGSGNTSLSLRPFIQFFWSDWDLTPLDAQINREALIETVQNERFTNFGISFIFYNGPQ